MLVRVLFFGRLREVAGSPEETLDLPPGADLEQLFGVLTERNPELARYRSSVVASLNQEFSPWNAPLRSEDEVAFLPPVSGG